MKKDEQVDIAFKFVNDGSRRVIERDEPEIVPETPEERKERDNAYIVFVLVAGLMIGTMFAVGLLRWLALYN
ncbi:MAG: hypothetical protein ACQEXV_24010 [Bacillota bacterium]